MSYGRGSITLDRGKFRVRVPNGKGKHVSLGTFPTRAEAETFLDAYHAERAASVLEPGQSLLEYGLRVIDRWGKAGLRNADGERSRWRTVVARAPFAHEPPPAITRVDIRDWTRDLPSQKASRAVFGGGKVVRVVLTEQPISWASQKHCLGLVSRVLDEAVEDGLIDTNPAAGVKLARRTERSEGYTWLRLPEIAAVLALDLTDQQRLAITLSVYQGLRQGELAALRWDCIDLAGGWLVIGSSWSTATKSGRARRIPILAPARAALETVPASQRSGLLLPGLKGELRSYGYDWGWGQRSRGRKDIPTLAGVARRVRWHDLRHTCAAHLVSGSWGRAWTMSEVQAFLGHSTPTVTARYAHLAPDALHATAAATAVNQPAADLPRAIAEAARLLLDFSKSHDGSFGLTGPGDLSDRAGLAAARQVCVKSAAEACILAIESGSAPPADALLALARDALGDDRVRRALRLAGGDLRAAIDHADDQLPDSSSTPAEGARGGRA